jgi:hypothetical protein
MSTRANIVYVDETNIAHSVYCHNDGYPQWVGRILKTNYTNIEKIKELISYGDMSSLRPEINPVEGIPHKANSFLPDDCQPDVCIFYHRDRGDKWEYTKPVEYEYTAENVYNNTESDIDYTYVWYDNRWNIYNFDTRKLIELTDEICNNGIAD